MEKMTQNVRPYNLATTTSKTQKIGIPMERDSLPTCELKRMRERRNKDAKKPSLEMLSNFQNQ